MAVTPICIIGAGAAGLITLILLSRHISPEKITIIDPYFDGGDLQRKWPIVMSNTLWKAAISAFDTGIQSLTWVKDIDPEKPTTLATLARLVREIAAPYLSKAKQIQGVVCRANWNSSENFWSIETNTCTKITAKTLVNATGGEPKRLDIPIPSIPLDIALDSRRLKDYIRPNDTVVVFGTRHSGTLVLKSALDCSANVIGIYKGTKPFIWARDGEYDGLKLDAAQIADDFTTKTDTDLQLQSLDNVSGLIRATRSATWVVYAMGFTNRRDIVFSIDQVPVTDLSYDGQSGKIHKLPNTWGFGLAYPNRAPDGEHWDVGIGPFVEHIGKQVQEIARASFEIVS